MPRNSRSRAVSLIAWLPSAAAVAMPLPALAVALAATGLAAPLLLTQPALAQSASDESRWTAVGEKFLVRSYKLPDGARPHDVAPDPKGGIVWYTAQHQGALGRLEPESGRVRQIPLGPGSRPHGVIVGPKGFAWVTDGGQNAIVRVDPKTFAVKKWPLPKNTGYANLNTAAFDRNGVHWFTGQSGIYGRLDPNSGAMRVFKSPRGRGPYGIAATPKGRIYFASLAGSYVGRVNLGTGAVTVLEPPTKRQGARRVWSDSRGRV